MRLSWGAFYAFLFLYRCAFSVLGHTVVRRLTALWDTHDYQSHGFDYLQTVGSSLSFGGSFAMQAQANLITAGYGAIWNGLTGGNPILINVGYQALAFIGIWRFLAGCDPQLRRFMAVMLMFPSFTLWSSIASKEAIVVFLTGVLGRLILDLYHGRGRLRVYHVMCLALLYVFKPHFIPAVILLAVVPTVAMRTYQPATLSFLGGLISVAPFYIFRERIDEYVLRVMQALSYEEGGSTRLPFLTERYDYFLKAPSGIFRSFFGPMPTEASSGLLQTFSFAESVVLISMIGIYVIPRLRRMPAHVALLAGAVLFWILMTTYPLGVLNAGTAVRYRTDYLLIVYIATVVLATRQVFARPAPVNATWPVAALRAAPR